MSKEQIIPLTGHLPQVFLYFSSELMCLSKFLGEPTSHFVCMQISFAYVPRRSTRFVFFDQYLERHMLSVFT